MKPTDQSAVGRYLTPLTIQAMLLLPMAFGQLTVEGWAYDSWLFRAVNTLIIGVVAFFVARNLVRLWRAPAGEACRKGVVAQTLVGVLLLLVSAGPLLESDRWSTKPLGTATALVGTALLARGVRDAFRMRRSGQTGNASSGSPDFA
jgi:hypothetical protein